MATNNINTEDVRVYAKALRLGNLRNNCSEIIHQAQIDKPSYLDFILDILKVELDVRQQNELAKRMKQARLPRCCDLDQFDFNHSAGVTKTQLKQLRELVWLDQNYNIILMGPSGTGKTFMTAGLIRDAVMKGYKAPTEWVSILQDEVLATALLDRLLYRCDVVKLSGTSYRMENRSGFLGKPAEKKEDRK